VKNDKPSLKKNQSHSSASSGKITPANGKHITEHLKEKNEEDTKREEA
jgi:hypothetical protein